MKMKILGVAVAVSVSMVTLQTPAHSATLGCLLGAAGGGFGGAQFGKGGGKLALTALGTLLGCGLGSSLQDRDQRGYEQQNQARQYQPAYRYQSRSNGTVHGGRGGYGYQPRPVYRQPTGVWQPRARTYPQSPVGYPNQRRQARVNYCASGYTREYTTTITVGGQQVPAYGTACRQPDGSWRLGPATRIR